MSAEAQGDHETTLVTLKEMEEARVRVEGSGLVVRTPLLRQVQALFPQVNHHTSLHLKMENMQTAGSFKMRGVVNQLQQMVKECKAPPPCLVTMSAGNYGRAFAHYLQHAGGGGDSGSGSGDGGSSVAGVCVMPITVPDNRVALIKSMGVRVEQCPTSELQQTVEDVVRGEGGVYCHSFDDPRLIAGYGTCSMEVVEEGVYPDVVVVCCGGGGLVSGMAAAFHHLSPKPVRVYAVEPQGANTMWESMRAGHAVSKSPKSVAAGLSPPFAGTLCYAHCRRYVEDVLLVTDQQILQAMSLLLDRGIKAEPSGCAAMAAVLFGLVPDVEEKEVLVVITGGNVSVEELHSLLPSPLGGGGGGAMS